MPLTPAEPYPLISEAMAANYVLRTSGVANTINAVVSDGIRTLFSEAAGGLYRSINNERTFGNVSATIYTAMQYVVGANLFTDTRFLLGTGGGAIHRISGVGAITPVLAGSGEISDIQSSSPTHGVVVGATGLTGEIPTLIAVTLTGYIYRSTDRGETWTLVRAGAGGDTLLTVAYGNGMWIAIGKLSGGNAKLTSFDDGQTWTAGTLAFIDTAGVGFRLIRFVAGNFVIAASAATAAKAYYGNDGENWTASLVPFFPGDVLTDMESNYGTLILGISNTGRLYSTRNGAVWKNMGVMPYVNDPTSLAFAGAGVNTSRWLVGGSTGELASSLSDLGLRLPY